MKILNNYRLSSLGSLILAVSIAWSVTLPRQITGNQLGGWDDCDSMPQVTCPKDKPSGKPCNAVAYRCSGEGDSTCVQKSSHSDCWSYDENCLHWWHQNCV